jgi:hypothetical protein
MCRCRQRSVVIIEGPSPSLPLHLTSRAVVVSVEAAVRAIPAPAHMRLEVTGPDLLASGLPRLRDAVCPTSCVADHSWGTTLRSLTGQHRRTMCPPS